MIIDAYINDTTLARLKKVSEERGETIEVLAEMLVENGAAEEFRHRRDDPGRQPPPVSRPISEMDVDP